MLESTLVLTKVHISTENQQKPATGLRFREIATFLRVFGQFEGLFESVSAWALLPPIQNTRALTLSKYPICNCRMSVESQHHD